MKNKSDYTAPTNPLRFDFMDLAADLAVNNWGKFGMTRELAYVAMQGFNHMLCDQMMHGGMEVVEKIISYNLIKGGASPPMLGEEHRISNDINRYDITDEEEMGG